MRLLSCRMPDWDTSGWKRFGVGNWKETECHLINSWFERTGWENWFVVDQRSEIYRTETKKHSPLNATAKTCVLKVSDSGNLKPTASRTILLSHQPYYIFRSTLGCLSGIGFSIGGLKTNIPTTPQKIVFNRCTRPYCFTIAHPTYSRAFNITVTKYCIYMNMSRPR